MENFNEPNNTESELETEVQIKIEPESDVWIKNGPETDVRMKNEPETDIDIKIELEDDHETELEFGVGTKLNNFLVRILLGLICSLILDEK